MKRTITAALLLISLGLTLGWASEPSKSQDSYLTKAEKEVQEWTIKLKSLQERSEKSGSKSREELDKQIKIANEKLAFVRQDLEKLRVASGGSWISIRKGLEDAMRDLKKDYRKAASYFDKAEIKEKS